MVTTTGRGSVPRSFLSLSAVRTAATQLTADDDPRNRPSLAKVRRRRKLCEFRCLSEQSAEEGRKSNTHLSTSQRPILAASSSVTRTASSTQRRPISRFLVRRLIPTPSTTEST